MTGEMVDRNGKPVKVYEPPPICPEHGCTMRCRSTQGRFQYYYCQVKTCKEAFKRVKPVDETE